ncbi:MAG: sec-independent protein translocase protein TatA [Verrucomicrobiota bacterium]|jgi:sec-independent protein translocase protein TatA
MNMLAFGVPGPSEWALILVIVLVLFGAKKLPELARSLGQSMNEFRKAREDFDRELHAAGDEVKGAVEQPYQSAPKQEQYPPVQNPSRATQPAVQQNPPS